MRPADAILPAYLGACLVLGGASNGGFLANLVLQCSAIAIIAWSLWSPRTGQFRRVEKHLAWLLALAGLVVALQFVPLPFGLWEALPGRAAISAGNRLAGIVPHWGTLSLAAYDTLASVIWALPALAVLMVMLNHPPGHCRWLAATVVMAMLVSVVIGVLQVTGGKDSALYFYQVTNRGSTVGFFANSNHLASLLLVSVPFLAALAKDQHGLKRRGRHVFRAMLACLLCVALVGIYANGSLAGYGLILPALGASAMILFPKSPLRRWMPVLLLPLLGLGVILLFATADGQALLAEGTGMSSGAREVIFARTWDAIYDHFPVGTGLGTFEEIYPRYEPADAIDWAYVNHAHNDYLELLLETGVAGGMVLLGFLAWWARRALQVWMARTADPYAMAGVIGSGLLLMHSLVDYPLRTAALSTVMAVSCALMTRWTASDEQHQLHGTSRGRT